MGVLPSKCLRCEKEPSRRDSKFCSPACRDEFAKTMAFALTCYCCTADEGVAESQTQAELLGWKDIEPDPEGFCWNFIGFCPGCRKAGRAD